MMNRGVVQQINPNNNNNWWNIINMRPPTTTNSHHQQANNFLTPLSWHDNNQEQLLPESWSHLLMSGMECEFEQENKLESLKQESSVDSSCHVYVYGSSEDHHQLIQAWPPPLPPPPPSASSTSPITSFSNTSMLDFSNNNKTTEAVADYPSSECNSSTGTGGAFKKARVQPSTTQSSTFKVRKEKLGDRITALHQLVSPFGKTDTASVLLEAIGYIRFLQSQIEALSLPYLGSTGTGLNTRHHHQQPSVRNTNVQGEKNCLFPEDPGQLLNETCLKRKAAGSDEQQEYCEEEEGKKVDLKSRGLCLVPVSCTLQVGSDNGADYWAPAAFAGGFR